MSFKNIRDGWLNFIKSSINKSSLSPEFSKEVEKRSKICHTCPELKVARFTSTYIKGKCSRCGCVFPALIFAPKKSCPLGKWGKYES